MCRRTPASSVLTLGGRPYASHRLGFVRSGCSVFRSKDLEHLNFFGMDAVFSPGALRARAGCCAWPGAGDFDLGIMAIWKSDALGYSRAARKLYLVRTHKHLETLEFREPYRIRGVQSSGDNWAIRRRMVGLYRLEIRNSNRKSPLILGSIANVHAQRTGGCSEAGGGRAPEIQPSPRGPW